MQGRNGDLVVGIGDCPLDLYLYLVNYPVWGTKTVSRDSVISSGGPAATAIVTLSRLGIATEFIGKLGDDPAGKFVIGELKKEGVGTAGIIVSIGITSKFSAVLVNESSGERTVVSSPNEPILIQEQELDKRLVTAANHLLLDVNQPVAAQSAARLARANGIRVSVDGGSDPSQATDLLKYVDILVASAGYFGMNEHDMNLGSVLAYRQQSGVGIVVGTSGSRGCFVVADGVEAHVPPHRIEPAVDTTGAGDVFHGSFIYGVLKGWDLLSAARFANVTAAEKCRRRGARGGIPSLEELARLAGITLDGKGQEF